uniref:Uncharacterized protein n=1 Tax=Mola mola TaxID=94237 RepID=A0A3Q3W0L6_MOLML
MPLEAVLSHCGLQQCNMREERRSFIHYCMIKNVWCRNPKCNCVAKECQLSVLLSPLFSPLVETTGFSLEQSGTGKRKFVVCHGLCCVRTLLSF